MTNHYLINLIDLIVDLRSATLNQAEIILYNQTLEFIEGVYDEFI